MKKVISLVLIAALLVLALSACGSKQNTADTTDAAASTDASASTDTKQDAAPAENKDLSGTVSTNGSTSMEKVIGALSE